MSPSHNPLKRSSIVIDNPIESDPKRQHCDISTANAKADIATSNDKTTISATDEKAEISSADEATDTKMSGSPKVTRVGQLLVKRLSDKARLPTRGSKFAAGFDLYSSKDMIIPPRSRGIVPTDLSIAVPEGTYGRVAPRSGLAIKHFIDTGAGVVDYDYRGPLGIVLFNFGDQDFAVQEGDRVAQLVLEKIVMCDAVEVDTLDDTERGAGGFGSTGVKIHL